MNAIEYKQLNRSYKSELFNFRGNKAEAKAFVQLIQKEEGFDNEGQALDYIFTAFAQLRKTDVDTLFEHDKAQKSEIYRLQNENTELQSRIADMEELLEIATSNSNSDVFPPSAAKLLEEVQVLLNSSLGSNAPKVSESDFVSMVLDFVAADPAAQVESILTKNNALIPELGEALNELQFPLTSTLKNLYPTIFNEINGGKSEPTPGE